MNDEQRRALADARETCERVSRLSVRDETPREAVGPNALDRWRDSVREREAEFAKARAQRQAEADAENKDGAAWRDWVLGEIRSAVFQAAGGVGETLTARFNEIGAALDKRDEKINRLEAELAALSVSFARLEVKCLQSVVDADRSRVADLPNPLVRRH
jgi:hypothetical protein